MTINQIRALLLAIPLALALLASCGGAPVGDPGRGQQLFRGDALIAGGRLPPCTDCHADTADGISQLGPNLSNIGNRAGVTVQGQPAEEYLRASILEPDAYLSGGFQEGIMYREYPTSLSAQQVADLVAYMETLKSGHDG